MKQILFVYDNAVNLNKCSVLTKTPVKYLIKGFKVTYLFQGPLDKKTKKYLEGVNLKTFYFSKKHF
jgi:hypothetical protein